MSDTLAAFLVGLATQVSLLLAGVLACKVTFSRRVVGALAGFGAGALVAAVSFDLVPEADHLSTEAFALWMMVGVAVFLVGDWVVERKFGDEGVGGAMGIVVGSVVDGVPESLILGIQMGTGFPVSPAFIGAVFVSNIPQAIAPSADLSAAGWSVGRVGRLWAVVVGCCALAAALGFIATDVSSGFTGDAVAALAAGGLLSMLGNSLMPFAFERGGALAGVGVAVGFTVSMLGT